MVGAMQWLLGWAQFLFGPLTFSVIKVATPQYTDKLHKSQTTDKLHNKSQRQKGYTLNQMTFQIESF
jgi:hypothetical protein